MKSKALYHCVPVKGKLSFDMHLKQLSSPSGEPRRVACAGFINLAPGSEVRKSADCGIIGCDDLRLGNVQGETNVFCFFHNI